MGIVDRAAIFIDGSNFYHGADRNDLDPTIDFHKFSMQLTTGRHLDRIYYYTAPINQANDLEGSKKQQRFFDAIKRTPRLCLKLGRLEKRPGGNYAEKGVDVAIAVDMLMMAFSNSIDAFYLVTADADFVPAVKAIQGMGKKVFNVYFVKHNSFHLRKVCNSFIRITPNILYECRPDP